MSKVAREYLKLDSKGRTWVHLVCRQGLFRQWRKGLVKRNGSFEIKRGETILGKGKIVNLQQDKKDVGSVPKGKECGLLAQSDVLLEQNDVLVFWS